MKAAYPIGFLPWHINDFFLILVFSFAKIECTYSKGIYTYLKKKRCLFSWVCDPERAVSCTSEVSLAFPIKFDHEIFNSSNLLWHQKCLAFALQHSDLSQIRPSWLMVKLDGSKKQIRVTGLLPNSGSLAMGPLKITVSLKLLPRSTSVVCLQLACSFPLSGFFLTCQCRHFFFLEAFLCPLKQLGQCS